MNSLHIDEWHNRYHLDPENRETLREFSRVAGQVMEKALDQALSELQTAETELLCIREVTVPVYLDPAMSLGRQAQNWSRLLAREINRMAGERNRDLVRRYSSPLSAWKECARSIVSGDLTGSWAWSQAGLIDVDPADEAVVAVEKLCQALLASPGFVLSVLVELDSQGLFQTFCLKTSDDAWKTLLKALEAITVSSLAAVVEAEPGTAGIATPRQPPELKVAAPDVPRFTAGVMQSPHLNSHLNSRSRRTAVLAALLVQDPALVCMPVQLLVDLVEQAFRYGDVAGTPVEKPGPGRGDKFDGPGERLTAAAADQPADTGYPGEYRGVPDRSGNDAESLDPYIFTDRGLVRPQALRTPEIEDASAPKSLEPSGSLTTRFGGLFYILNIADEPTSVVRELVNSKTFAGRSNRWRLMQLAITLGVEDCRDAAARIFAGCDPGLPLTEDMFDQASPDQQEILAACACRLFRMVDERINATSMSGPVEFDVLLKRRARIYWQRGWVEVEFSLADVDTAIRRAGLDFDPGFLPWLATFMRFRYA